MIIISVVMQHNSVEPTRLTRFKRQVDIVPCFLSPALIM